MKILNLNRKTLSFLGAFLMSSGLIAAGDITYDHFYKATDPMSVKEQKAIELVNNAIAYYQKYGLEAALETFKNRNGPFCIKHSHGYSGLDVGTIEGVILASCKSQGLIGKNISAWKSPDGTLQSRLLVEAVKQNPQGVIIGPTISNFNPSTGKPAARRCVAREIDGLIFSTPIYVQAPLHTDIVAVEDMKAAQDPKNAQLVDIKMYQREGQQFSKP